MRAAMISGFLFALFLIVCCYSQSAQLSEYPLANLSTTWTNNDSISYISNVDDDLMFRDILEGTNVPQFSCGFVCMGACTSYLFAVFLVEETHSFAEYEVVWSANRDDLVQEGAILNLTASGELVLQDVDGRIVWTTNTTGKSVVGMQLTDTGNLVLFDVDKAVVWQSFDHPTDSLLPGQKLYEGQKLIPSVSLTNWSAQQDLYTIQVTHEGVFSYFGSNPPHIFQSFIITGNEPNEKSYVMFLNGSLSFFIQTTDSFFRLDIPPTTSAQYMKLMPDGHLQVFEWQEGWIVVADLLQIRDCDFPLVCGTNAICSANQQCSCPRSGSRGIEYFQPKNAQQPNLGCSEITPLTCNSTHDEDFIPLKNVKHFIFSANMKNVNMETCKKACLNNCSCKAAFFEYDLNSFSWDCYLPSELFTMRPIAPNEVSYNAWAFIKVQKARLPPPSNSQTFPLSGSQSPRPSPKKINRVAKILGFGIGSSLLLFVVVIGFVIIIVRKQKRNAEMEEEYLDQVPGMPTRFSYEELKVSTQDFNKKLGQGGFGSVFEGTLEDGSRVAVKCLEGLAQVKKSFLAEVESIGSIHHVNLVRLVGFCAWKSQRLLVYEFMSNGSLDQWIYHGKREHVLEWECRKNIILGIAKGLTYLHEDCRQKIIHLDIKPQNILLDSNFNAKVSDFGLAKLIDRNQTQVMTTMRGTPGYLAPEWLSSVITEKVDVYSFGIVLLEILCGRKNFDRSLQEESWHLLAVFQRSWEQGTLLDIVDMYSEDMQEHGTEVLEMLKVASWCLQTDFTRRPSMSSVVKVLEGGLNVEPNLDYNFTDPRLQKDNHHEKDLTPLLPSFLSGPR